LTRSIAVHLYRWSTFSALKVRLCRVHHRELHQHGDERHDGADFKSILLSITGKLWQFEAAGEALDIYSPWARLIATLSWLSAQEAK
jgi:hypothetical protein